MAARKTTKASADAAAAATEAQGEGGAKAVVPQVRRKEFSERVAALVGGKRKGMTEVVDATLRALGEALEKGEAVNLAPFGRTRPLRSKEAKNGNSITLRLLRSSAEKAPKQPLAAETEDV